MAHRPERSRVTDKVKLYSDLDLLVYIGRRLNLNKSAVLTEAFSASGRPWRVDVVNRHGIDESFWRRIKQCLPLRLDA